MNVYKALSISKYLVNINNYYLICKNEIQNM
jgi:hypothetical protein